MCTSEEYLQLIPFTVETAEHLFPLWTFLGQDSFCVLFVIAGESLENNVDGLAFSFEVRLEKNKLLFVETNALNVDD